MIKNTICGLIVAIFTCVVSLSADDMSDRAQKISDMAKNYPDMVNMQQRAQEVFKKSQSNPYMEKMKAQNGEVAKAPISSRFFASNERIYIFISSSVPKGTIMEYIKTISKYGLKNDVILVMRGFIGGGQKMKPTLKYIRNLLTVDEDNTKMYNVQIWIDPPTFRKYQIAEAPVFVFTKDAEQIKDMPGTRTVGKAANNTFVKSRGDWAFDYHIKQLYEQTKNQGLKKLMDTLAKDEFYSKGK